MGRRSWSQLSSSFNVPPAPSSRTSRCWAVGVLGLLLVAATACGSSGTAAPTSTTAHGGKPSVRTHRSAPSIDVPPRTRSAKASATSTTIKPKPRKVSARPTVGSTAVPTSSTNTAGSRSASPTSTKPAPPPVTAPRTTAAPTATTAAPATTVPKMAVLAIRDFAFVPSTLVIAVDTTVSVTNHDTVAHTWTSNLFDSGPIQPGSSFKFTFTKRGTYRYHCTIHPFMTGTIVVN